MLTEKRNCVDLTTQLTSNTVIFPGDPNFESTVLTSINQTCAFNLREIKMGNHTGTHIDFPGHVLKEGKLSSDYFIHELMGEGIILEVPEHLKSINRAFIEKQTIREHDIVFFKTSNSSRLSKQAPFIDKFVYIELDAAKALLEKKVRIVGIDYISVDAYEAEDLPTHNFLLSHEILIVENLELKNAAPGRCQLCIMPLNIPKMDGLPARVVMFR